MKFTVPKTSFAQILTSIQGVIKNNSTLPILSHALIRAEDGRIVVSASDLDSLVIQNCQAEVTEAGAVTLPAKRLLEIIRAVDSLEIAVSVEKTSATIKAGKASFNLIGDNAEEFPPFDSLGDEIGSFSVGNRSLARLIHETSFCAGQDDDRHILKTINVEADGTFVQFVASDGKRMAHSQIGNTSKIKNAGTVLLPVNKSKEFSKFLNSDGETCVSILQNFVKFNINDGQTIVLMRTIEGNYPNWRQVFPSKFGGKIEIAKEEFLSVIKRAAIVVSEKAQSIKLSWSKNNLNISAKSPEVGNLTEDIEIKFRGEPFEIAFNPRYLIDALGVVESESVVLNFTDGLSPMVIESGDFKYLLLPIRIS